MTVDKSQLLTIIQYSNLLEQGQNDGKESTTETAAIETYISVKLTVAK